MSVGDYYPQGFPPTSTPRPMPEPTLQSLDDLLWAVLVVHGIGSAVAGAWLAWRVARWLARRKV